MSNLPDLWDGRRPTRAVIRAIEAQEQTELAIHQHSLETGYLRAIDQIDSEAIADVVSTAMEEEMKVLSAGLGQAAGSPAKAELVARLVALQSRLDNSRIARRFGGR
jgi:hypothetical protein